MNSLYVIMFFWDWNISAGFNISPFNVVRLISYESSTELTKLDTNKHTQNAEIVANIK